MRDDTPTFAAEEAHAHAHAPEWARADLPGPDELDWPSVSRPGGAYGKPPALGPMPDWVLEATR